MSSYYQHRDDSRAQDSHGSNRYRKPRTPLRDDQESNFLSSRREERTQISEEGVKSVWALSPSQPDSDSEDEIGLHTHQHNHKNSSDNGKANKKRSRKKSESLTSSESNISDSEEERRKRKKRKRKKEKKHKEKVKKHKKKHSKRKKVKQESDSSSGAESLVWEEKEVSTVKKIEDPLIVGLNETGFEEEKTKTEDLVIGPMPEGLEGASSKPLNFGHALLPGEGAAMAAFVSEGKRIPRRGEIGLTSDEIVSFEDQGYVMSGSRHRRMEAVRLRKENQIYSADEKRALASFNKIERDKRETRILSSFKELVNNKISKE
uniref:NF-kappa-B-activating protein-like n=1 Tax=Ciona intestinalis TaxID=7719 RepID=UPI000180B646|nr:NF-kappa-B-activating protein-like [Ciona intestinalis]|eukprot:XP_002128762.1 NF-kappa-B-activating protein-like [Ciona intestinalis]